MWDSLSPLGYDLQLSIAAWTTGAAGLTTVVLFCYTLGLRFATVRREHRRRAVIARWRGIVAAVTFSETQARQCTLPRYARNERTDLLEEWNSTRATLEGDAVANLIILAERLGFQPLAREMLRGRKLGTRLLAIQTLGHMHDRTEWIAIASLLDHPNTALSVTAAAALAEIDPVEATPLVMPRIVQRADWPQTTVARILKSAGPAQITQALAHAILTSDAATSVRLLKYSELARGETIDQLVELILRERDEPAVLSAAMKATSGQGGVPRIAALTRHEAWYVRMQAAKLLGRVGQERDLPLLEHLLGDREWWVRYRAAQAIVSLPFVGPGALRALRDRQTDAFAGDMMQQAMAEVGLE
jgi:HEAT repeat protein